MILTYEIPAWVTDKQISKTRNALDKLSESVTTHRMAVPGLIERHLIIQVVDTVSNSTILAIGALIGQIQAPGNH